MKTAHIEEEFINNPIKGLEEIALIAGSDEKGYKLCMRRGWVKEFETIKEANCWTQDHKNREEILKWEILNIQEDIRQIYIKMNKE